MMFGQLTRVTGKQVTLNVDEDIDISRLRRWSDGKQPTVELIIDDGRRITPDQRKKIFAMLGDMSDYLGYSPREIEEIMKTK
ncbi:putative HNHc nuclease, partial [Fructilactobacillus florum]